MFIKLLEKLTRRRIIKTPMGVKRIVKTSAKACRPYGFLADDLIVTPNEDVVIVQGVGKVSPSNTEELWYRFKHEEVSRFFIPRAGNLKLKGFCLKKKS